VTAPGWTPARARRLDELAGPDGVIAGAAIDHRDSLQTAARRKGLPSLSGEDVSALKVRIARALAPAATLVLLDVEYGAAQAIAAGALPGSVALAVPLEAQGYGDVDAVRGTTFLADWSPAAAARLGASACKLLLPYRADDPAQADAQDEVVQAALDGCRAAGLALILEPIVAGTVADGELARLVVQGARRLAALGPDILKLQYPGSADACGALDEACGPTVPWVLLGGGADAETLERQIGDACAAGASGFIVGRTLWDAGLVADEQESEAALRDVSRPLLERLADVARRQAQPWRERVGAIPAPEPGWYRTASSSRS
jgi:tagatose-1,6-bisphosphate aldolase